MEQSEYQRMAASEEQHWWYRGLHDLLLRWLRRESADSTLPLEIMDAGCGTGRLCQLMQAFGTVAGCDLYPAAIAATRGRGISSVFQANLVTDPLGHGRYDVITCVDVLYHRAVTDEAAVLRNLHRALRQGGLLLLHAPAFECLRGAHDAAVHTQRRYRREGLLNLLTQAGFTVEFASYRLPLLFLPTLLWRLFSRRHTKSCALRADTAFHVPPWLNAWLVRAVCCENRLLAAGWRFPFGLSLFVGARKIEWHPKSAPWPAARRSKVNHEQVTFLKQYHNLSMHRHGEEAWIVKGDLA
jgi:2-polyprenyl-3-methyl-5-hydroxy-6-metoxy-1,4-benzoquinol methylase